MNEPISIVAVVGEDPKPGLPTYATVADVLEQKNGSGWRLAGWTLARTLLIAPPMLVVGVPVKKAFGGALLASGMISVLTLMRIGKAANEHGVMPVLSGMPSKARGDYSR